MPPKLKIPVPNSILHFQSLEPPDNSSRRNNVKFAMHPATPVRREEDFVQHDVTQTSKKSFSRDVNGERGGTLWNCGTKCDIGKELVDTMGTFSGIVARWEGQGGRKGMAE